MEKYSAEEFKQVKEMNSVFKKSRRSVILDKIAELNVGEALSFFDDEWDLKSSLSVALHGRFMGNRKFRSRHTDNLNGTGRSGYFVECIWMV